MKLNPDCVRDILLYCEENCAMAQGVDFIPGNSITVDDRTYDWEELSYHLRQCDLSGYFYKATRDMYGEYFVLDISPSAHEFLANVRQQGNWIKVKSIAEKVGSTSLSALSSIAVQVVSAAIKSAIGLP